MEADPAKKQQTTDDPPGSRETTTLYCQYSVLIKVARSLSFLASGRKMSDRQSKKGKMVQLQK
jgi:hypothetical protein